MPALSLSPAERSALRSQAHPLKPVVLIGAEGLTEAVLAEIEVHLAAHQLIKIRMFGDDRDARLAIYHTICERLDAAPIQHIGKLLVIWKPEKISAPPTRQWYSAGLPSAREAAAATSKQETSGKAPRIVKVVKRPPQNSVRKPKPQKILVRGNERVTAGGNIKRAKKRQASAKRPHQNTK